MNQEKIVSKILENFDGRNKKWTLNSEYSLNGKRIKKYHSMIGKYEVDCNMNIEQRIGMESTMGEVYKVSLDNKDEKIFLAGKILPITNDNSFINNEKEIRFAIEASELVLNKNSLYFTIVYDFSFCNETYFYTNNDNKFKPLYLRFYEKSLRYQQFQKLLNLNVNDNIKNKILKFKKSLIDPDIIVEKLSLKVQLSNKIQSHILFSELACFDLNYYLDFLNLNNSLILETLYHLLKHIFLAIGDMSIKLNLLHNDLHLGNILLINDEDYRYIPLIHDFGKSRKFKNITSPDSFEKEHDLFFFLGKFEEKISDLTFVNEELEYVKKWLGKSLSEVIDIFYDSNETFPILDVIKYWESLEYVR